MLSVALLFVAMLFWKAHLESEVLAPLYRFAARLSAMLWVALAIYLCFHPLK